MAIASFCDHCGAENAPGDTICYACHKPLAQGAEVIGTLLNERYEVLNEVGAGGFGAVYRARDTKEHERLVAVKQINLQGLTSQEIIEATDAFNREAEILSTLSHPLLPSIFDRFSDPEHWYLVMTYIDGETLDEYLQQHHLSSRSTAAGLPLGETLEIALQLCDALHYLHSQQPAVIFRDLKPGNIMRTRKGRLYLIDFGIARRFKPGQAKDTIPFGSPGFAAPEQYGRAQTTPQADIYSLGALLYCLLTGDDPSEHPFDFPPLRQYGIAGTRELDRLIQRMVERDPMQRPANIEVVQEELQRIQQLNAKANQQNHIWTPPQGQTPPADGSGQQHIFLNSTNTPQQKRKTTRRRVLTTTLVLGGVAAVGGIIALASQPQQTNTSTSDSNWGNAYQSVTDTSTPDATATATPTSTIPQNGSTFWSSDLSYAAVVDWSMSQIELYKVQGQQRIQAIKLSADFNYPSSPVTGISGPNIEWSPDNSKILVISNPGMIYVWSVANGQQLFTSTMAMAGNTASFPPIASWSPDSNYCAISYRNASHDVTYTVLRMDRGEPVFQTILATSDGGAICAAAWSPDSRYLAFPDAAEWPLGTPWSASIWDRETSRKVSSFGGILPTYVPNGFESSSYCGILSIVWSPKGEKLATFLDNVNALWINQNGDNQAVSVLTNLAYTRLIGDQIWSPDEKYLALPAGTPFASQTLQVWNTSNWAAVVLTNQDSSAVQNGIVAFSWTADSQSITIADQNNNLSKWTLG